MADNIGYMVTDGQFQVGSKTTKGLFTGGILIPEQANRAIIYTKIKDDIFARAGAINGVKSNESLAQDFKTMYEIAYDKGENSKFKGMRQEVKDRFLNFGWWSLEEVLNLKTEILAEKATASKVRGKMSLDKDAGIKTPDQEGRIKKMVAENEEGIKKVSSDKEEGTKKVIVDRTDVGSEVTLYQTSESKINVRIGENGPIICVDADKIEDVVDDPTGAIKALVSMVPKLLESNANLNRELREEKAKLEALGRNLFESSTSIISKTAKIRDMEESVTVLRIQVDEKDADIKAKEDALKEAAIVLKDENLILKETVLQIKTNTEMILKVCNNPKQKKIAQDGYCEALYLIQRPMQLSG